MGIEDIQISEELETNAPSIKYSGNEGPKSPQEMEKMMMASLEEEYAKYVFDMEEQGIQPMSLRQFIDQAMAEGQMSKGPILPSPEDPVNPFGPKPQGPVLPNRQMAAFGGIMGIDGRRQYGIGSKLKKFARKIIPNEVAEIAVKAAPFVAPFNPIAAGLMSGIGGFDQTGRIGSSLKSGLKTYGMGQLARGIGGGTGNLQTGFDPRAGMEGMKYGFSNPLQGEGGLSKFLADRKAPANLSKVTEPDSIEGFLTKGKAKELGLESARIGELASQEFAKQNAPQNIKFLDKLTSFIPESTLGKVALGGGLLYGGSKLLSGPEETVSAIMERGDGLDLDSIRLEVREAFKDPSGKKLAALRNKYPYLGTQASKDVDNMAQGGRIGFAEGGGIMDLGGMEKDYRAEGGFVPIGREEKADDVPARLSVNEFVFTADAVRNAGGGDIDRGAEVMENMMKNLEAGGQVSEESQGIQSLRAGGRAGFANGLRVDTDKVIEDIKKFSIPGLIGRGVKAGANKISDIDLESIIKVVAKAVPGGMVMEKVTEFLVDRYGMSPDEAQMRIVNKLGTDANEGFKNPSGTSDEGYRMVGIESSAEDTSDIPTTNRLRKFLGKVPSREMPRPEKRFPEEDRFFPDGPNNFPRMEPYRPEYDENGNEIRPYKPEPYRPEYDENGNEIRPQGKLLQDMFNTSQRLSEVVG